MKYRVYNSPEHAAMDAALDDLITRSRPYAAKAASRLLGVVLGLSLVIGCIANTVNGEPPLSPMMSWVVSFYILIEGFLAYKIE